MYTRKSIPRILETLWVKATEPNICNHKNVVQNWGRFFDPFIQKRAWNTYKRGPLSCVNAFTLLCFVLRKTRQSKRSWDREGFMLLCTLCKEKSPYKASYRHLLAQTNIKPTIRIELMASALPRKCSTTELCRLFASYACAETCTREKTNLPFCARTRICRLGDKRTWTDIFLRAKQALYHWVIPPL